MSDEIELKLQINQIDCIPLLQQQLGTMTQQCQRLCLKNTYYDTPSQWLRQHKAALRIRDTDGQYEMTLKTAGQATAGLHQRAEYNVPLINEQLALGQLPAEVNTFLAPMRQLAEPLSLIFRTDFQRHTYLVHYQNSEIECAIDQGSISSGQTTLPLCELELELKHGQVEAIFALAQQLSQLGGLQLSSISKAARGYQLAYPSSLPRSVSLANYRPIMAEKATVEHYLLATIVVLLEGWQHYEESAQPMVLSATIGRLLALYRQIWRIYGGIIPRQATAKLRESITAIEQLLVQGFNGTALINHPDYLSNKLVLVAGYYVASWRDSLDDKARTRLATSAKRFADILLGRVAADLKATLVKPLTATDYQDKRQKWQKNIDVIWLLAGAYPAALLQTYLACWQQLLLAVEQQDWSACEQLRQRLRRQVAFWRPAP